MKLYFKKMTPAQNVYKIYAKYIDKVLILFLLLLLDVTKIRKCDFHHTVSYIIFLTFYLMFKT